MVATKPMRVDAQRNRERLLAVASAAFSERGVDVPLDEIARRSDVGIGTLYRHFPTRDALIEAVYRREVVLMNAYATELLAAHAPVDALSLWLQRFVGYVATKRGMAEALKSVLGADSDLFAESHRLITGAIDDLVAAAVRSGEIRADIEPLDLLRAVGGICMLPSGPEDWPVRSQRLVGLLMDGLRYR